MISGAAGWFLARGCPETERTRPEWAPHWLGRQRAVTAASSSSRPMYSPFGQFSIWFRRPEGLQLESPQLQPVGRVPVSNNQSAACATQDPPTVHAAQDRRPAESWGVNRSARRRCRSDDRRNQPVDRQRARRAGGRVSSFESRHVPLDHEMVTRLCTHRGDFIRKSTPAVNESTVSRRNGWRIAARSRVRDARPARGSREARARRVNPSGLCDTRHRSPPD